MNTPKTLTEFCNMPPDSLGKMLEEDKLNILCKTVFGSHLYGTNIEGSDTDIRGCFLPSYEDCYLGKIRPVVNTIDSSDSQLFSLHKLMRLAAEGQSVAIELLFTPDDKTIQTSVIWEELKKHRNIFLTKKMKSFMGFAKTMALKYSARADRLSDVLMVRNFVRNWCNSVSAPLLGCDPLDAKLFSIWDGLPQTVNLKKSINTFNRSSDKRVYVVCGKEYQIHLTVASFLGNMDVIIDSFGERVKLAQETAVDWKAITHAFRVTYQCKQAVEEGTISFPCKEIQFLRDLRIGKYDMVKDDIDLRLDNLIKEVDDAVKSSNLPDEVDWEWCEKFIVSCY